MSPAGQIVQSDWNRFLGANIKGTPAMAGWKVGADLRTLKGRTSVLALQEFRWPWYWARLNQIFGRRHAWGSNPGFEFGRRSPVKSAAVILWRHADWRAHGTFEKLLHHGYAKISEARWLRGVRLVDRAAELPVWVLTGHFVVGGDRIGDPDLRREILDGDLDALDDAIAHIRASHPGEPILFQGDLNIAANSHAHEKLMRIVKKHRGRVIGTHGVEYLIVFQGLGRKAVRVDTRQPFTVGTHHLHTDHEARGVWFKLWRVA